MAEHENSVVQWALPAAVENHQSSICSHARAVTKKTVRSVFVGDFLRESNVASVCGGFYQLVCMSLEAHLLMNSGETCYRMLFVFFNNVCLLHRILDISSIWI